MWHIFKQSRQLQIQMEKRWLRLYRVAYALCHDPHLASDLVQETMQKALKKNQQLQKQEALDSWLHSILVNCWRDHCRSSKDTVEFDEAELIDINSADDDNERAMIVNQVRKAIASLPRDQREVVTLVDLEGMSYGEVATTLDVPIGTVMSRLCRARRQLKESLEVIKTEKVEPESATPNLRRVK